MGKIGIDVYIKGKHPNVDPERLAAVLAQVWISHFSPDYALLAAKNCASVIMDSNDTAIGTAIGMPSIDAAEDLRDDLIDLGLPAEVIDHDAASS